MVEPAEPSDGLGLHSHSVVLFARRMLTSCMRCAHGCTFGALSEGAHTLRMLSMGTVHAIIPGSQRARRRRC